METGAFRSTWKWLAGGSLVTVLLVYGCGGGGGGTPTPSPVVPTGSAQDVSAAIFNGQNEIGNIFDHVAAVADASAGVGAQAPLGKTTLLNGRSKAAASTSSSSATLRQALEILQARKNSSQRQKTLDKMSSFGDTCLDGGSWAIQVDDQGTPLDESDDITTMIDRGCTEDGFYMDGTVTWASSSMAEMVTFTNSLIRVTDATSTVEDSLNGTIRIPAAVACGGSFFFEDDIIWAKITITWKEDTGKDGTFEVNEVTDIDVSVMMSEPHGPAPDCTPGRWTSVLNGTVKIADHVNAKRNATFTFTGLTSIGTPSSRTINSVDVAGDEVALIGTITVSSECVNGTFTISTPAGKEPFAPNDASCPIDGTTLVTGPGTTAAIHYTASGGVDIDEGNNGSIEKSFASCDKAEACSSAS